MKNQAASIRDSSSDDNQHEAWFYTADADRSVQCHLCAHQCRIADGKYGICQVRQNIGGTLYTLVYGKIISGGVDPVEKKPLFHFFPGSRAYSIATPGCNFRCEWCQNWQISQMPREEHIIRGSPATPQEIVAAARATGCRSIAYTYTEPTIFSEYAYDVGRLANEAGIANIYVTNGYMSETMLSVFASILDAANVDLKAFRDETYRRYVGARLEPVLDSMKTMKRMGIWLEVTTLVIPGLNDDPAELRDAAAFVATELGPDTPWHISRFYPGYRMLDRLPTPLKTLRMAAEIGLEEGLKYIYIGNALEAGSEDTHCPNCGRSLIERRGYQIVRNDLRDGRCPKCGALIAGVWE